MSSDKVAATFHGLVPITDLEAAWRAGARHAARAARAQAALARVTDDSTLIVQFARIIGSAVYGEPDNLSRATATAEAVLAVIRAAAADEQEAGR